LPPPDGSPKLERPCQNNDSRRQAGVRYAPSRFAAADFFAIPNYLR
jgi:hypothetical protein